LIGRSIGPVSPFRAIWEEEFALAFTVEDRFAINDLIAMHGHFSDSGDLDRYAEIFTADVEYEVGGTVLVGCAALADAGRALGAGNPVGHHVTNVVLLQTSAKRVRAVSKFLGVKADGTTGSGTYEDTIVRTDAGWRIAHRRVIVQRTPLNGRF
jgi:3-phenylpropionate/cinnamic acid dioxygenase small subunit